MKQFVITINNGCVTVQHGSATISGESWRDLAAEAGGICSEISRDIAVDAADISEMEDVEEILRFAERMSD